MTAPLIEFRGVEKAFGPKVVSAGVDLSIAPRELTTILGASGCGKSVLLKMLIGLIRIDRGSIHFDGARVDGLEGHKLSLLRQRIAMLFQAGALFDSMSVERNVAYGLEEHFRDRMTAAEIAERVAWALDAVGLPGVQAMEPADLSGGMKKRVALARAIAVRPEVVLFDEPTTGLDPINTARVNNLILDLKRRLNITCVVVTHDMKSAFTISDRMVMLHSGIVIAMGTVDEMKGSQDQRVSDFIEGRAPVREDVESLLRA